MFDAYKLPLTNRLGKASIVCQSFKNDVHKVVSAVKIGRADLLRVNLHLNNLSSMVYEMNDFRITEAQNAKKNISTPARSLILRALPFEELVVIDKNTASHPIVVKEPRVKKPVENVESVAESQETKTEEKETFEQMSIFDDID